ncbi:hypothetical protein [Mycolicibacterium sp.]|uniref:hypothetical protein n=1 Tax=Mycolicibacterium sp. TaxID=2320850 RepID=UPI0025F1BC45|nr:hypothetical protein [Mycolicibacterium sp.]
MTAALYPYRAEDIETLIVAHLSPLGRSGFERHPGDPLPFRLVCHITGAESADEGTADPVVSVHTLCDKSLGAPAARDAATATHRRMVSLIIDPQITLTGGRIVAVQYLEVVESPRWEFYSDTILRKVGRYRIGLPYVAA